MVSSITSFSRNGLSDWLIQRVSAVLIGLYTIFMLGFLMGHTIGARPMTYQVWHDLFEHSIVRLSTFIVVLSIAAHAWIGLWTVFTDYVQCTIFRLTLQIAMVLLLLGYVVWSIEIIWG